GRGLRRLPPDRPVRPHRRVRDARRRQARARADQRGQGRQRDRPRRADRRNGEPARGGAAQTRRRPHHLRRGRARHGGHGMSGSAAADELRGLVRAGWRLAVFETFEEERALNVLERVAEASERRCVSWTVAAGLAESGEGTGSFDAGLEAVERFEEPAVFAMLDAHRWLDDAIALRRLRDLLPTLGARKQCIVLVGPVFHLPVEIERDVGRVSLPLPGAAELAHLFARVLEQGESAVDPEALGQAIRGALGLTSGEAVRVLRKALRSAGALDGRAVGEIVRDKRRALHRTPALTFLDDDTGLADV